MLFWLVELAEMNRICRVEVSVLHLVSDWIIMSGTEVDMALIYLEARDSVAIYLHICNPYLQAEIWLSFKRRCIAFELVCSTGFHLKMLQFEYVWSSRQYECLDEIPELLYLQGVLFQFHFSVTMI